MREHLSADTPFYFVADPENTLYNQYGVERSLLKVMRGLLHGLMAKVSAGKKLFTKPTRQDGNLDRITAEFIIRDDGKLATAHYSRFLGDQLPIGGILEQLAQKKNTGKPQTLKIEISN